VNKILVIGSLSHRKADTIEWTRSFCDLEKYDYLIIDLTCFPKNFPKSIFNNIGILKRTSRLFKLLLKQIPLNYSWMPFPQKLTVRPMLLGKTITITNQRFTDYFQYVEKWDNELFWEKTENCIFETIAVNKSQNPIAATITMINRGKIHFLPKTSKPVFPKTIKLLIDLTKNKK
jgi:hypothetical protein